MERSVMETGWLFKLNTPLPRLDELQLKLTILGQFSSTAFRY
jgi:hypothetical protein